MTTAETQALTFREAVAAARAEGLHNLPEHTHRAEYEGIAPVCVRCGALGVINPDTGTAWAPLGDHGEQVIEEASDRFADLLDGPEYREHLATVLAEAYLRGQMQGRFAEREELSVAADRHQAAARIAVTEAGDALTAPDGGLTLQRALGSAQWHAGAAHALRRRVGR